MAAGRVAGEGDLQDPGHPAGRSVMAAISASTWAAGAAGLAAGQPGGQSRQLPLGLGQGLVEAAGLAGVEGGRVGQDHPAGGAERLGGGLDRGQSPEPVWIHEPVAALGNGQQLGVLGGWQRGDVVQPEPSEVVLVGGRVVAGVEGHGQLARAAAEAPVAGDQLVDDRGELGDVGLVARVGAGDHRDPAIAGDHQRQADQPQVMAFLLGLAALGDRRLLIGRVDEGGEVGHVQHQARTGPARTRRSPPGRSGARSRPAAAPTSRSMASQNRR